MVPILRGFQLSGVQLVTPTISVIDQYGLVAFLVLDSLRFSKPERTELIFHRDPPIVFYKLGFRS
jgi:hypothetical protein